MNPLQQAIQLGDIDGIQSALITYITSDPLDQSSDIARALQEIEARQLAVWDAHNGRELELDRTQWTKEYFAKLQSHLITNFSKERFDIVYQVGKEAYKEELRRVVERPTNKPVYQQPVPERQGSRMTTPPTKPKQTERRFKNPLSGLFGGGQQEMDDYRMLQEENVRLANENSLLQREVKQQQYKLFELAETNANLTKKVQVLEAQLQQLQNQQKL